MFEPVRNCRYCSSALEAGRHQMFRGVCSEAQCRNRYIKDETRIRKNADEDRYKKRCEIARKYVVDSHASLETNDIGIEADVSEHGLKSSANACLPVFPVPALQRQLTSLPPERRRTFLRHLKECVDEAFEESLDPVDGSFSNDGDGSNIADPSRILGFACGTCRGDCCRNGSTHAFVSKELVNRVRRQYPKSDKAEIFTLYESKLLEKTHDESCVFQQEFGCGLPRELRANLCNTFECEDLVYLQREPNPGSATIAAMDGEAVIRVQKFVHPKADAV